MSNRQIVKEPAGLIICPLLSTVKLRTVPDWSVLEVVLSVFIVLGNKHRNQIKNIIINCLISSMSLFYRLITISRVEKKLESNKTNKKLRT